MKTLEEIQADVKEWWPVTFGQNEPPKMVLYMVTCLGGLEEAARALDRVRALNSLGSIMVWLCGYAIKNGITLHPPKEDKTYGNLSTYVGRLASIELTAEAKPDEAQRLNHKRDRAVKELLAALYFHAWVLGEDGLNVLNTVWRKGVK